MARGDHIKVRRSFYWHHGVDLGDSTILHLSGEPGRRFDAVVRRTPLVSFLRGGEMQIVRHRQALPVEQAVARGLECLGRGGYSVVWNNCEHFARWCVVGRHESKQVRDAIRGSVAAGTVGTVLTMLARRQGVALLARAVPILGPVSAALLVAGALSSLVKGVEEAPFDQPADPT